MRIGDKGDGDQEPAKPDRHTGRQTDTQAGRQAIKSTRAQHTTHNTQHTAHSTQHTTHTTQHATHTVAIKVQGEVLVAVHGSDHKWAAPNRVLCFHQAFVICGRKDIRGGERARQRQGDRLKQNKKLASEKQQQWKHRPQSSVY